jgi:tetratricopeptide (TPR) repeat protein
MLTHEKRSRFLFFALGIVFVVAVVFYFTSANGLFAIGNFFFGGGAYDVKLAGKFYEMTLKKDPEFPRANYQLGRTYFIRGDFSASWYYIEKEIKYYPDFPKSYYMRGLIFGYVNHLDAAENDFKKFLSLKPNSWGNRLWQDNLHQESHQTAQVHVWYHRNLNTMGVHNYQKCSCYRVQRP